MINSCYHFRNYHAGIILCLGLVFYGSSLMAQRYEDVVYLKNGSIVRGMILPDSIAGKVRILNHAGDLWVFGQQEVDHVKRERPFEYKAQLFGRSGLEVGLNAAFLMRSGANAIGSAVIPGVNLGIGYRFNPFISAGVETGMEFYEYMVSPLTASVRLRATGRALSPLILLKAGFTLPAEKIPDDWEFSYTGHGGICTSIGLGLERILNENASFLFTFSYHYQELNYHLDPLQPWSRERDRTEAYSRLRVGLGYIFK